jgi:hypothetical protein
MIAQDWLHFKVQPQHTNEADSTLAHGTPSPAVLHTSRRFPAITLSCCAACRCGMDIPEDSATNASVSGIRVWCPEALLSAAAARLTAAAADAGVCPASPELMHHLRIGLQEELNNPRGKINQQVGGRC